MGWLRVMEMYADCSWKLYGSFRGVKRKFSFIWASRKFWTNSGEKKIVGKRGKYLIQIHAVGGNYCRLEFSGF